MTTAHGDTDINTSTGVLSLTERVAGSLVRIGRAGGRGSGFVFGPDQVVTAAHNLRDRTTTVTFPDGRSVQAAVTGVDLDGDLVVLAVDTGGAAALEWSDPPDLGQAVTGVATLADGAVRVVAGSVTAIGRRYRGPQGRLVTDGVEHDASLGRGTSGGPLLAADGRVVGVNVRREQDGFTLARPATKALRSTIDGLARGESVTPVRLGITVGAPEMARRLRAAVGLEPREGVFVAEVVEASVAAEGGIRRGDVLISAGGAPITDAADLHGALVSVEPGSEMGVRVVRAVDELDLTVVFPSAAPSH